MVRVMYWFKMSEIPILHSKDDSPLAYRVFFMVKQKKKYPQYCGYYFLSIHVYVSLNVHYMQKVFD